MSLLILLAIGLAIDTLCLLQAKFGKPASTPTEVAAPVKTPAVDMSALPPSLQAKFGKK